MQKKLAWITGATSGIGAATARSLVKSGYDVVLTGRRETRLQELKNELQKINSRAGVFTVCFDLQSRAQCEHAIQENQALAKQTTVLINNAGLAKGVDPMPEANLSDWEQMIDTNVKGLLYMTRLLLPFIKNNQQGHIVNLGSVAGRWTYPGGGVYCATKFAVRALSEGLRLDLQGSGVRVTNVEPGMVETEFSIVRLADEAKAKKVYEKMTPLSADDIAETINWCLSRPAHVNIQELVIYPTDQAAIGQVVRRE